MALAGAAAIAWLPAARAIDEQEQRNRILFETRQMEEQLEKSGVVLGDAELDAYLQGVLERLFPENRGKYRVRAIRDHEFNAFAVASGNLYVNTGALARMRNEAELAAVLGHEGGHVAKDHMYRAVRSAKTTGALTSIFSVGLVATIGIDPGLSSIIGYSSMAGFSRDYERESDRLAYERMVAAGYDPSAGAVVFDRMARELEARKIEQGPYFFASHPRLEERVANFREFAASSTGGEMRRDEYIAATARVRTATMSSIYETRDGRALVYVMEEDNMAAELAPSGYFYQGEGYRLRAAPGDEEKSVEAYRKSVAEYPEYAPAWGGLGRYAARHGDRAMAIEYLERFLALAPESRDAPFARQALARLKSEVPP
jgi:beta-barrel assembly-enhancing protease